MHIAAKYENGAFRPLEAIAIKEGTVVESELPAESDIESKKLIAALDSDFFGLWKDREDITDSVEFVNKLRIHPRP